MLVLNRGSTDWTWQCYQCTIQTDKLYIFSYVYFILLHHCINFKNIPPRTGIEPGPPYWESSELSTAPQRLKSNVYLCIYILHFCTCLVLKDGTWQVRIPLCPPIETPSTCHNHSTHLTGCGKCCKSANCKLHFLRYLYIHSVRWLV